MDKTDKILKAQANAEYVFVDAAPIDEEQYISMNYCHPKEFNCWNDVLEWLRFSQ